MGEQLEAVTAAVTVHTVYVQDAAALQVLDGDGADCHVCVCVGGVLCKQQTLFVCALHVTFSVY